MMTVFDDRLLLDEIKSHILRQLDPGRRADRYTLYHCLFVSRRYFEIAAKLLWSTQILNIDLETQQPCKILLDLVSEANPPASGHDNDGDAPAPGTNAARRTFYLHSLRALQCHGAHVHKSPTLFIHPNLLLSWITRLDSIDVMCAPEPWSTALTEWLSVPGRRPRHVRVSATARDGGILPLGLVHEHMRTLALKTSADGEMGRFLAGLMKEGKLGDIEVLRLRHVNGPEDLDALARFLVAHGGGLRSLQISSGAFAVPEQAILSMPLLTHLSIPVVAGTLKIIASLLTAASATLEDLKLDICNLEGEFKLPMTPLRRLKSLGLHLKLDAWIQDLGLERTTTVTRLTVTSPAWRLEGLAALTAILSDMTFLRELSIFLGKCLPRDAGDISVHLPIRLRSLQKLHLEWPQLQIRDTARLSIVDADEIESSGLPLMEDIKIWTNAFEPKDIVGEEGRAVTAVLEGAMLDERMSPALVSARIKFACSSYGGNPYYSFGWRRVGKGLTRRGNLDG
ncbi:hypothetical protein HK101_002933 [Irineochytrium annulatum]|nr:hypothetical protein HK101_002933 [Irineochytrium annulatum]